MKKHFYTKADHLNLLRGDVLEHVSDMRMNGNRFFLTTGLTKTDEYMPDCLMCRDYVFGLMFSYGEHIYDAVLRMSPEMAERYGRKHKLRPSLFPFEDDWYLLFLDGSFKTKRELYQIIYECYDYALTRFGHKDDFKEARSEKFAILKAAMHAARPINECG